MKNQLRIPARSLAALAAALVLAATPPAHAASQTWTNNGSVSGNWSQTSNWSGNVTAPGATSGNASTDVATFNTAVGTYGTSGSPVLIDSGRNIKGITFDTSAGNYTIGQTGGNNLLLTNGGTIQIAATLTGTNVIETINAPLQIQGASAATYTFTNLSANGAGTLNFGGGITGVATAGNTTTLTVTGTNTNANSISGIIGDGSAGGKMALTKSASLGTWVLSGANTYTGATNVNGGTMIVNGTAGSISTSASISIGISSGGGVGGLTGATLQLDNTAGNVDRIGNARTVTLFNLGELALIGNTTSSTTETIGGLTVGSGSRGSSGTVTLSGTASGLLTTLASGNFTRVNNSTALIRGTSLGQQATNATRLTISDISGLTFVGATTANGTSPGSAKDVKIVPYLLGDTSATGNGSSFVTYDTTGGLRPLSTSTEYTTLSAGYTAPASKENVIAFSGTITAANPTVNSLLFNTASQTLNGSGTLTVQSGAIAAVASSAGIGSGFSSVTLGDGTWNEGILTASSGNTLTINAPIAVTGGSNGTLTKTGAGIVIFNAGSSYDAVTNVTRGELSIAHNNALGSTVGGTVVNGPAGGYLTIQSSITVAEPLTLIDQRPGNGNVLNVQSGQNTLTGAITASGSNRWSISGASLTVTGGITVASGASSIYLIADATTNGVLKFTTTPLNLGSAGTFYQDTPGLDILAVAGNTWGTTSVNGNTSAGQSIRTDVANALPSITTVTIGSSTNTATLDLNGNSQSIVSLASGGNGTRTLISANAASLAITGGTSTDYAGTLTGALGLTINKSGNGTQTLSGANTHTGDTLVSGGTLALGHVNALRGSTLDTGTSGSQAVTFTVSGNNTYNLGGLKGSDDLAIGNNTISVGANNQSTSFTGVIGAGAGGLTKVGTGALTLGANNTYTGATAVNAGSLVLDYTASNTNKLSDGAALALGSATLQLDRSSSASGNHTEIVASTTLNGAANITRGAGSTAVLQMNAITRNAGATLNLGAASIANTDTNNTNGILGPWATINGTDWATSVNSGAADTAITAYTGYTDVQRLTPGTITNNSTTNVRLTEGSGSGGNITLGSATTTINTLNQSTTNGTSAATIDAAGKTLAVNGILVGSSAGALTIGTSAGSGTLQTATSGGELLLQNFGSNNLTINSVIGNNTTASGLTQAGTGTTVLAGVNTYTGKTIINGGKISIAAETGLGSNPGSSTADQLTLNGGTLLTTATLAIDDTNRGITLGAAGGTFEVTTGTTTIAATSVIAGSGGLTKTGAGQLTLSGTANTYTGPTTLSAGILSVSSLGSGGANSTLGAATKANTNLIFDGGTLQYTGASSSNTDRFFTINAGKTATIEVQAAAFGTTPTLTLGGGAGATSGALTKTGLGTLSLTGGSDYTGATTVSAGILQISANNALGATSGTTTVASGASLFLQGSITVAEPLTLNSTGTILSGGLTGSLRSLSGVNTLTGPITIGSNETRFRVDAGQLTLSGGVTRSGATASDTFLCNVVAGSLLIDTNPINVGAGWVRMIGGSTARWNVTGNIYSLLGVDFDGKLQLDVANALNPDGILQLGRSSGGAGAVNLNGFSQTVAELRTDSGALGQAGTRTIGSVAPATLTVNQSTTSTYDGALTGALALTKSGTGTLTLTGNTSTTTGDTTINGGTLQIGGAGKLGSGSYAGAISNNATFVFGSSAAQTLSGVISGNGSLTKNGTGTLTLTGNNSYTGVTTISTGVLAISNANALGTTAGNTVISGSGGAADGGALSLSGNISVAEPLTVSSRGASDYSGAIVNASGSNTLTGAITLANDTWINGSSGTLTLSGGMTGSVGQLVLKPATGALLKIDTAAANIGSTQFIVAGSTNGTVAVGITGNTWGTTQVYADSILRTDVANALPSTTAVTLGTTATPDTGGTLDLNGFSQTIASLASSGNGSKTVTSGSAATLTVNGSTSTAYDGVITGAVALAKQGSSTLTLSGNNSYTGATNVNAGTLAIGHNNALGTTEGDTTVASGATLALSGGITVTGETLNLATGASTSTLSNTSGTNEWTGAIVATGGTSSATITSSAGTTLTLSGSLSTNAAKGSIIGGSGNILISGVVSGGKIYKNGVGTLTLSGSNTYDGLLEVSAGTVSINSINSVGSGQGASALGTASSAGNGQIRLGSSGTNTAGTFIYTGGAATTDRQVYLYGQQAGADAVLDQSGTGLLTFTSALGFANSNTNVTRTLTLQGSTAGTGEFAGAIANQDTANGKITALTKAGTGTWTLSGSNSYTGATTISVGTLLLNGSISSSSAVNVSSGATLGGNGTAAGAVSILGTLAPGNSIGTINVGDLTLGSTGILGIELGRSGGTPDSDRTNVTGTVQLVSGASLNLTIYTGLTSPVTNDIFFLVINDGGDAISGEFTKLNGSAQTLSEGSTFNWNSQDWQITYRANFEGTPSFTGGNDLAIQVVPEPATWALLAFSLTTVMVLRRRRRE